MYSSDDTCEIRGAGMAIVGSCELEVVWMMVHFWALQHPCVSRAVMNAYICNWRPVSLPHPILISSHVLWIVQRMQVDYKAGIFANLNWLFCTHSFAQNWVHKKDLSQLFNFILLISCSPLINRKGRVSIKWFTTSPWLLISTIKQEG